MKRLSPFVAVGLTLCFAARGFSQQAMIGVRGGVNLANEHYSNNDFNGNISTKPGLLAGAELDYLVNKQWELSGQILFDQKGANAIVPNSIPNGVAAGNGTANWTANYIEVPLLIKAIFGKGIGRPYLFAGTSLGFLLSNKETIDAYRTKLVSNYGIFPYHLDSTYDISDSTAKLDYSLIAGMGVSFELPSGPTLFFDATYAFGLVNTDKYSSDNENGLYIYSRDIRLAAGILFPLP